MTNSTNNSNMPGATVDIKLDFPLTLRDGSKLETVTMRSPTVRDRLMRAKDSNKNDIEADINMIASLTGLNADDILNMEGCDYLRLEAHFSNFLLPVGKRVKLT